MEGSAQLYAELWVSLASLLRSYTAAHGLNGNRQATVELGEERITVRQGDSWLDLRRLGSVVVWTRENGSSGTLEMTGTGHFRSHSPTLSARNAERMGHPDPGAENTGLRHPDGEEMDVVAEAWARELMR